MWKFKVAIELQLWQFEPHFFSWTQTANLGSFTATFSNFQPWQFHGQFSAPSKSGHETAKVSSFMATFEDQKPQSAENRPSNIQIFGIIFKKLDVYMFRIINKNVYVTCENCEYECLEYWTNFVRCLWDEIFEKQYWSFGYSLIFLYFGHNNVPEMVKILTIHLKLFDPYYQMEIYQQNSYYD